MQTLPIDALLPEIVASLRRTPNLVVEAPPGAGKTTRVPAALLDADLCGGREIWVLEPRRLAARLPAARVAEERGERLGDVIGYQVRFEDVASRQTRLRFLTEGVFTRRLLSDPQLSRVGAIVLDEFHERHLQTDVALAVARRLQLGVRPDLMIVAMSATLDAAPIARFLGDCPTLRSEGRQFEVQIEHLPKPDERPLATQIAAAVNRLIGAKLDGDALVFLPGAAEIKRAQEACAEVAAAHDLLLLPLHGELSSEAQDLAIRSAPKRKVILSTNVAETSVTIDGVAAVIDAGLARRAGYSPWSGLPQLVVAPISRAAATQRAGRAGRTREGRCLRLYTEADFAARPAYETPEITRADLAETTLELHALGVDDLRQFEWFESPPHKALEAAENLLTTLGAIDRAGQMTERGRRMLRAPLHPRLARLVVEAEERGAARDGYLAAALLSERDIRARRSTLTDARVENSRAASSPSSRPTGPSDVIEMIDLFDEAEKFDFAPERVRRLQLDPAAVRRVERVRRQLSRGAGARTGGEKEAANADENLSIAILAAYPDRVGRRRAAAGDNARGGEAEILLAGGAGVAYLAPESVVRAAEFLVAIDAEERRQAASGGRVGNRVTVRTASRIEPEWLIDLFPEAVEETTEAKWNQAAERVEVASKLTYRGLTLAESRVAGESAVSGEEAAQTARLLKDAASAVGLDKFVDRSAVDNFLARIDFARRTFPEADFPPLGDAEVEESFAELCRGRSSFAELRAAVGRGELLENLRRALSREQINLLAKMAPESVRLGGNKRQVKINYERDRGPWVESRLQDFFGMREGPRIADGRAPLVLHLLAPNRRAVQVTSDLANFWAKHYPQVRRELGRRYPRHAWPEDPLK